ncbi:TM182 protein, partial [Copsychus sechellarum]|nr:TM182 protein [Copsychus sechellarum]
LGTVIFPVSAWTLIPPQAEIPAEAGKEILTFHHEGFFWRCWFFGEGHSETIWTFWYSDQAHPKFCMHGYLFPMPIAVGPFPHPSYDTTAGEFLSFSPSSSFSQGLGRDLGCVSCGSPVVNSHSQELWKAPSQTALLGPFLLLVFLFVMWKEFAADFQKYILLERSERCLGDVPVRVYYGWSFMFAAAGVPLALLSGLLFFLVGRDI